MLEAYRLCLFHVGSSKGSEFHGSSTSFPPASEESEVPWPPRPFLTLKKTLEGLVSDKTNRLHQNSKRLKLAERD